MPVTELYIAQGVCEVIFAYDVGLAIDLEACGLRLTAITQRARLAPKHRTPGYFEYRPAPLHLTQETVALRFGAYCSSTSVDVVLYDFGAVSITYHIPLHGPFLDLLALSETLADNAQLLGDSRQRVEALIVAAQDAVQRPHIADFVEDYAIFQVQAFTPPCAAEVLHTIYAQEIAQILRVESAPLSRIGNPVRPGKAGRREWEEAMPP